MNARLSRMLLLLVLVVLSCITLTPTATAQSDPSKAAATGPPRNPCPPGGHCCPDGGCVFAPVLAKVSPSVQTALNVSFASYNEAYAKGKVTSAQASVFTQAYGTWLGNLAEAGYFVELSKQLQQDRGRFVAASVTPAQANAIVNSLALAGVKTVSAQRLIDVTRQADDLDRNTFAAQLSTPEKAQEVFASLATQINQQVVDINNPNEHQMRVVDMNKNNTACKDMAKLLLVSVYSGNKLGAEIAAAALAPDCGN